MNSITPSVIDLYDAIADSYARQYVEDTSDIKWIDTFLSNIDKAGIMLHAG